MKKELNISTLGKKVLIELQEKEKEKDGFDIIYSDDVDQTIGTVVKIGKDVDSSIAIGDKVLVNRYSGTSVTIENVKHRIILDDDVLLKFS